MKRQPIFSIFTVLILALFLSACGGGGSGGATGDPGAAAKSFFDAVFSGGSVDSMICTSAAAAAKGIKDGMDQMNKALTATGAKVDATGLTYTVSNKTNDAADVKVGGKLKVSAAGQSTEQPFPDATIKMKAEGGAWKVCG